MPTFEPPAIVTDPDTLLDDILDRLADRLPGWEPIEGSIETALAEEFALQTAVVARAAQESIAAAVAGIGESVHGLPAQTATAATAAVEVTVTQPGAVIPAGLVLVGNNPVGIEQAFIVPADVVTTTTTQTVTVTATETGAAGNGVAGDLIIATVSAAVVSARIVPGTISAGGRDNETIAAYLDRLVDHLSRLRLGGVRARDLAAVARTVPGVYRAVGLDLYDPATPGVVAERTATIAAVDQTGQPVPASVRTAVQAAIESVREINFVARTTTPTYTPVHLAYTAVADSTADPAVVKDAIDGALEAFLTSDWGAEPSDPRSWTNTTTVRLFDVARAAAAVPGVAAVLSLTINGAAADLPLPGAVPYPASPTAPSPSTVTGTVQ